MRRVVVTGMGIVSSLGQDTGEVLNSLKQGVSGIKYMPDYEKAGLRCCVAGTIDVDLSARIERKKLRFMGDSAAYTYLAMEEAIADANLSESHISNVRTGCILGTGGASTKDIVEANSILESKGVRHIGPYRVSRTMGSTISACISTFFKIKGLNYSISSACATSAHCIGHALEQIQFGKQDIVFAGGGESEHYSLSCLFDAMGAFTTSYNDNPEAASRPYDKDRDGFVISGGGGVLVLEELDHALARGAKIYAEVVGYGTASDGDNMVSPSGDGAYRAMEMALSTVFQPVDYLNTHGTSTPVGDVIEIKAATKAFQNALPPFSSTKSLSGHALGAAGVHEAIYSLLMLEHGFIAASHNIENLDEGIKGFPVVEKAQFGVDLKAVMSNSFGFGGTNASLIFQKFGNESSAKK